MQKAVFLVTQGAPRGIWARAYEYRPYNWGPYSAQLNEDLSNWQRRGFMVLSYAGGTPYGRYTLTRHGVTLADSTWNDIDSRTTDLLTEVRSWVTSKDFNSLLREVYEEFPDFATQSRWVDPR
ncbi:MAG TPA: hypothetical protein VFH54_15270 [Mycobacteriales bacterium]|nr:hypothetical protein [Mycobacteriales bacterium]